MLGIFSALLRYGYTYNVSADAGHLDRTLFSYMHFHTVFLAMAVFVFVKELCQRIDFSTESINVMGLFSSCSLGIYLIHKVVMDFELKLFMVDDVNVYWRFLGPLSTYLLCLAIVLLVKRIPIIKAIFP